MNSQRGYDDSKNLTAMADGLANGKYASVHQAAKSVLEEQAGPNVDRRRRKYRAASRSGNFQTPTSQGEARKHDRPDWWLPQWSELPSIFALLLWNFVDFLRSPSRNLKSIFHSETPIPFVALIVGVLPFVLTSSSFLLNLYRNRSEAVFDVLPAFLLTSMMLPVFVSLALFAVAETSEDDGINSASR
jgi:cytosine/uracil/thiamine/allantoin permease